MPLYNSRNKLLVKQDAVVNDSVTTGRWTYLFRDHNLSCLYYIHPLRV